MLLSAAFSACDRSSTEMLKKPTTDLGKGGSEVSGSSGPAGTQDASKQLMQCEQPIATVALVEAPGGYAVLSRYNLPASPLPLVRLIMQQSGCFRVVDRAAGLAGAVREQELKDQGITRTQNHSVAKGQAIEAQLTLAPSLTFSEIDAGRGIAGVLASIPVVRDFAALIGVIEQARMKEAQTVFLLTDNQTTEQIAAATGSARITDFGMGGLALGKLGGAGALGWSNSNEGKVIAAAFLDAHNRLVVQLRATKPRAPIAP